MKYEVSRDVKDEWRWALLADNHKIVAVAGEGYKNKADCLHAIGLVQESHDAPVFIQPHPAQMENGE